MADTTTTPPPQPSGAVPPATVQQPAGAADEPASNAKGWEAAKASTARADALAKELETLKAAQAKRETDESAKRGEFENLWKAEQEKAAGLEQKYVTTLKRTALAHECHKLGLIDLDALNLVDLSQLEIDGESVKNAAPVAAAFATSKPWAFNPNGKPNNVSTSTAKPGGAKPLDLSNVKSSDVASLSREDKQRLADAYFKQG